MATPKKKKTTKNPRSKISKEQPPIRIIIEVVVRTEGGAPPPGKFVKGILPAAVGEDASTSSAYNFVIKIKKLAGLTVQRIDIQNGTLYNDDLKDDPSDSSVETGKTSSVVPGSTFLLTIMATGEAFTATTFNLTCDGKKVFSEDQEIKITSSGRGGYRNLAVPLP